MPHLVMVRHGQSEWNAKNLFTGWVDVPLSEQGIEEARNAGRHLRHAGYRFDIAYTSVLKRAIHTLHHALGELEQEWVDEIKSWRLNERHYGALQGLDKQATAEKYGEDQVHRWRRSYDVLPPLLEENDEQHPRFDPRYRDLDPRLLPAGENLKLTLERVMPFWQDHIAPDLRAGRTVLIAAHGNSLRALIKYLDGISDEDIPGLELPTGVPLVYELDDTLAVEKHYRLET
ncbi:2,3-diphosphoglycerate-dependent phosphoglycerate mutase [Kushneria phosphatilytica]|uniref:2,3-bisphosphoglycerate-dependent phosphoglycerate mutase n=1 Tax=Kushneria phosphatilytica TaxID=657387 RepID=A0A1S1NZA2_9GAMM|nr:2,3-diphosphoglycerate-dependent phosphoglycerate mutase [Kushneria phosphatilytica]OHV10910.1 phosphoglyceromutase [Kushneria phosphatilytica]QEL12004.1 2,3-diphosphoglycerate-dependent phosphoglycerate mutase [Kushneria phosphatilytica]